MLRRWSCGYILYKRDVVCNGEVTYEAKGKESETVLLRLLRIEKKSLALPGMEEEETTLTRREALRWLRSIGTKLRRGPPPHSTPPPIFILCSPFLFLTLPPSLSIFLFPKMKEKIVTRKKMKNKKRNPID